MSTEARGDSSVARSGFGEKQLLSSSGLHYSYELRIAPGEGNLAVVSAEANSEGASTVDFKMCYPLTPWNKTIFNLVPQ